MGQGGRGGPGCDRRGGVDIVRVGRWAGDIGVSPLSLGLGWFALTCVCCCLQAKPEATVEVSVSECMQEVDFKFKCVIVLPRTYRGQAPHFR